jgi:glutathione synthase/RimK-type ligase-like ATP-grasp enzyme
MGERTVNIGLSLGADICWPIAYENLLEGLKLDLKLGRDRVNFACERVTIEPFDLRQPVKYDLVIDRLTHWYSISREWIKKAIVLNDLYVYNNPWSIQANEKHTSYCAMMRLGLPIPDTWMLPAKAYEHADDLEPTLRQYARLFSLDEVGEKIGYPFFMKPYHGGGWRGVTKIDDAAEFHRAYDKSGTDLMNLQ